MTEVMIYCNGATVSGELKDLTVGRPMMGPVRCDEQVVKVLIVVRGPETETRLAELQEAAGMPPQPIRTRAALILAANVLEAEIRRLDVDYTAWEHGCEESEVNARRRTEYERALETIREMLRDGIA